VLNQSSRPINELYVSPQTADQWGEDRLGDRTLEPGASLRVHLGRTRGCVFDFKIIYDDASREEQRGVDLCRTRQLAFDGSAATPAPDSDAAHSVTLVDQSAAPIQQVFISPAEANQWGDDVVSAREVAWPSCLMAVGAIFCECGSDIQPAINEAPDAVGYGSARPIQVRKCGLVLVWRIGAVALNVVEDSH
jgi:hypothetical protein